MPFSIRKIKVMTYKNERHLKRNEIKIRVNDDDLDVIDAIASYTRQQRAVLMREYAMREIRQDLVRRFGLKPTHTATVTNLRGPKK